MGLSQKTWGAIACLLVTQTVFVFMSIGSYRIGYAEGYDKAFRVAVALCVTNPEVCKRASKVHDTHPAPQR